MSDFCIYFIRLIFGAFYRAKKVVLQGTNVAHLLELQALAMSLSLPTYLVQDAGVTQVRPDAWRHTCALNIISIKLLINVACRWRLAPALCWL